MPLRVIVVVADIAIVPLTKGYCAIIDAEDEPRIRDWNWSAGTGQNGSVYAIRGVAGRSLFLHRAILDDSTSDVVDHINRDTLDCRKSNLRPAAWWQNIVNQKRSVRNKSGFRGVFKCPNGRFKAQIGRRLQSGGASRTMHIGYFSTAEAAARAYDKRATELFGEFAALNFPGEGI